MLKESANSCVKCALSSLGASPALRRAIDDLAVRAHTVAVRGTHLVNHLVALAVNETPAADTLPRDLPDVFNPGYWQRCIKVTANPRSGKQGNLHAAAARLFTGGEEVRLGRAATHAIETLSKDLVVNIKTMLVLNFHRQLRKAFRRDVLRWAAVRDFEFDVVDREQLVDYCVWRCVQQGSLFKAVNFPLQSCGPEELRVDLQAELDEEVDRWRSLYGGLLPSPVPAFISNFNSAEMLQLFRWSIDLQRQRRDRQEELSRHFSGDAERARKCFGAAGKAMRALPLCQLRVGHVAVDRTALKFLLLELQEAGEPISDLEIPLLTDVVVDRDETGEPVKKKPKLNQDGTEKKTRNRRKGADDQAQTELFWAQFPGAARFVKKRQGVKLHPFVRTDGISRSVALIIPGRPSSKDEVRALKAMETACDLSPGNPRPLPREHGQRLCAIDPGRRDMVYCLVETDEATPSCFRVSTRQHVREAKRRRIGDVTVAHQKRVLLSASSYHSLDRHSDLHSALCQLPSSKAFETYHAYEAAMLPMLEEAIVAMRARRLRREALLSYKSKDRALDLICSKICGGVRIPPRAVNKEENPRVLVAFGNGGKVSTTGCGYAPAPQGRLRHRLQHVWGARVSLINEYRTSKCCCECGEIMSPVYKTRNRGVALGRAVKIHGVLRCKNEAHGNGHGHGFVHRDRNAAANILSVYVALAAGQERPKFLCPPKGSRYA